MMRIADSRSCWRRRCSTTRHSRTCSEKTSEARGAASSSYSGNGASRAESAACVRTGRVGSLDHALPVQTTGRHGNKGTTARAGRGTPQVRLSATGMDARTRGSHHQSQEAVPDLSRGAADGTPAARAEKGIRHESSNDAAGKDQPAVVARLRLGHAQRRPALPHPVYRRRLQPRMPGHGDGTSLGGVRVVRELDRLTAERALPRMVVSDNELSKKAMAGNEYTSATPLGASNSGYDQTIVEKRRRGSLRVGAPSRVRSQSSPADAALDRRRHCG